MFSDKKHNLKEHVPQNWLLLLFKGAYRIQGFTLRPESSIYTLEDLWRNLEGMQNSFKEMLLNVKSTFGTFLGTLETSVNGTGVRDIRRNFSDT